MDLDEAIEMFAAMLSRSYGPAAEVYARRRASDFGISGDQEGREVWERVAEVVTSMEGAKNHSQIARS
jgi:hypothetical protein